VTDTTAVDVDALLAEIFLTPEGKADPYPRYAAIREQAPMFRSGMGFVVVGRYEDCQWVLRDARLGKGEMGPLWEAYGLTEDEWRERTKYDHIVVNDKVERAVGEVRRIAGLE